MLYGSRQTLARHLPYLGEDLQAAFNFLLTTDWAALGPGEYHLAGRDVFARVSSYATEAKEDRKPERHLAYIDIHYLAAGREAIWYRDYQEGLPLVADYSQEQDLLFYADAQEANQVLLSPQDWAVFFPWELHRPNCHYAGGPEQVLKVVVKVRAR